MQNRNNPETTARFCRFFTRLSHFFWALVLIDSLYIAGCVLAFCVQPSAALSHGILLSSVPVMMEHIFMSILLLTAAGTAAESVLRSM